MSRIGLALIVRDEENHLPALLNSIEGAFDEVALLDTGSIDRTVELFKEWAIEEIGRNPQFRHHAAEQSWTDDFSRARNTAQKMLSTDWIVWADADDTIQGAGRLRQIAAAAPPEIAAFAAGYDYGRDEHGNCVCWLVRERMVRAGAGVWHDRVHESQRIDGPVQPIPPEQVLWIHRKDHEAEVHRSSDRNMRILTGWLAEDPDSCRALVYQGTEHMIRGELQEARPHLERYLDVDRPGEIAGDERAQVRRKLAICLLDAEDLDGAIEQAEHAIRERPDWPDSYLTLAQAHHAAGRPRHAAHWARHTLQIGAPASTHLITNPLEYTLTPRLILSSALSQLGQIEEALEVAEKALKIADDPQLRQAAASWQAVRQREAAAQTWLACARQLVQADEQIKALVLLEQTVPHYVTDHPEVVASRSELRERIGTLTENYRGFYRDHGSTPADFIPDDQVDQIAGGLPRSRFLLEGLRDQEAAAA